MIDQEEERESFGASIGACEVAMNHLNKALDELKKASNWGLFDLFGGGMIATMVKHSKMDGAKQEITMAKNAMNELANNLRHLDLYVDFDATEYDFLDFADFFFDGMVADFLVQSRIRDTTQKVEDAIFRVGNLHRQLVDLEERSF